MAFVRRAPKRVQHLLIVFVVAAGLLVPIQLANWQSASASPGQVQVGAGANFACALSAGGIAQCWGYNSSGQLGNGLLVGSGTPVSVSQSSISYSALAVGGQHACGLAGTGQAYCWGLGSNGQLGYGGTGNKTTPFAVTQGGVTFTSVSAGNADTCALTAAGQAYCWGAGAGGQLGNGGSTDQSTPVAVTQGGVVFTSISVGGAHTCGLTSGGQTYCWGGGAHGELGNGLATASSTPVAVFQSAVSYSSISSGAGEVTCGLSGAGQAYCWGWGGYCMNGNGSCSQANSPVVVSQGGVVYTKLQVYGDHACGMNASGQAYCWGTNTYGELGDGTTTTPRNSPVVVSQSGTTFSSLARGASSTVETCGVDTTSQRVWCWGQRAGGRIGDGLSNGFATKAGPVAQASLTFTSITAGNTHTCALTAAGQAYCWGQNNQYQIGNNNALDQATPVAVSQGGTVFTSLAAGQYFSCGLTGSGQAYCWGLSNVGQVGNGGTTVVGTPSAVSQGGVTFTSITAGVSHACGLTSGGQAYCWGSGTNGQLGNGANSDSLTPVAVTQGGVTYTSISAGNTYTCGLTSGGQAYCWGYNNRGQIGNSGTSSQSTPAATTQGGVTFSSISAGNTTTCALTAAGQAYCWGAGASGGLGNGLVTSIQSTPVSVTQSGVIFTSVVSNQTGACGLSTNATAYCWGSNANGQNGDGSLTQRNSPVAVSQGGFVYSSMSSGSAAQHVCALASDGKAYCWGYDLTGQLGIAANPITPILTLYFVDSEGAVASATIDPSFSFAVAGRATACNGSATPTGAATSSAIDLGHLTTASPVLGAQDFTAATNAGGGFSVSVKFSGPLTSTSGPTFTNASGSAGTPAAFGAGEGFGYTTSANAGFAGPLWAGPTTSYASLYTAPGTSASVSNCIAYQAQAGPLTPAGSYSVTVIYLATPTF